jgi:acyl-CoA thioester hydrolase
MTPVRMFTHTVRVPYAHTDQMGVVYYAHYLVYFEMARAELLREVGVPYGELEARGVLLPVVDAHCEYMKSARFDDCLEVLSRCSLEGIRLRVDYEVRRGVDRIATGYTHHVCMGRDGKVLRPVPEIVKLASG